MYQLDCATCWKTGPKFTIYFPLTLALISIITCILDLAMFGGIGYSATYLGLNLQKTFEKIELWRLISTHFICNSIWMTLFFVLIIFWNSMDLERKFGFKRYITLILISLLLTTALACAFGAFFGLVPGINYWSYFEGFWHDNGAVGPTQLCILLAVFEWRVNGKSDVMCCCCIQMKMWVMCLIDIILTQLVMYPPWNGLWYNIPALIVGWSVPKKFLAVKEIDQVLFTDNGYGGQQANGYFYFQTINGDPAPEAQQQNEGGASAAASPAKNPKPEKKADGFSGRGRTL